MEAGFPSGNARSNMACFGLRFLRDQGLRPWTPSSKQATPSTPLRLRLRLLWIAILLAGLPELTPELGHTGSR